MQTAFAISGGFLGCQLGSGELTRTDWLNLGVQIAVATGVQIGLAALAM